MSKFVFNGYIKLNDGRHKRQAFIVNADSVDRGKDLINLFVSQAYGDQLSFWYAELNGVFELDNAIELTLVVKGPALDMNGFVHDDGKDSLDNFI